MWRGTEGGAGPWRAVDEATTSCGARAQAGPACCLCAARGTTLGRRARGHGGSVQEEKGRGRPAGGGVGGVWHAGEKGRGRRARR
jgi:hypothetical protein